MEKPPEKCPVCFGDLDTVFPMGEDGLRHTPAGCMTCEHKTGCLRAAMKAGSGDQVREEMVDRAYDSGLIGFFQRWSRKKHYHHRRTAVGKSDKNEEKS